MRLGLIFIMMLTAIGTTIQAQHQLGIQFGAYDNWGTQTGKYFIHDGWNYPATKNRTHLYWRPTLGIVYAKQLSSNFYLSTAINYTKSYVPASNHDSTYIKKVLQKTQPFEHIYKGGVAISYIPSNFNFYHIQPYVGAGSQIFIGGRKIDWLHVFQFGICFPMTKHISCYIYSSYHQYTIHQGIQHWQHQIEWRYQMNKALKKSTHRNTTEFQSLDVKSKQEIPNHDIDLDGVADSIDICPQLFGSQLHRGCPDSDHDGLFDEEDKCPDFSGSIDMLGCPDTDQDGIIDIEDKCPHQFGLLHNSGCPDELSSDQEKIDSLAAFIIFEPYQSTLQEKSIQALESILSILRNYAEIEIEGHTDNSGNENQNIIISQQRADACMQWLIAHGYPDEKIQSVGYGSMKEKYPNDTVDQRAKNRRIEIIIKK